MLLIKTSLRYLQRHPWQIGLCILGVALGVAMVVAIDLANSSARSAFTLSVQTVAGRATHQVVGGPSGLDEALYRRLRVELGLRQSAPLVEGYVRAPTLDGRTLQLIGVDPLAEQPFRDYLGTPGEGTEADLAAFFVQPGAVLMAAPTARRYDLAPGDRFAVLAGPHRVELQLIGLIEPGDALSERALENLLIADIATAQESLALLGRLSRIDLILDEPEQIAAVEAALPPGTMLTRPEARSNALDQMTRAFELNLSALSLLALVVGVFLIYNTMTFSVVQRRGLFGTLRCIGVSRRQVGALIMAEAALISLVGSLLGLGLGVLLGRGLVQLVTRTINDLYFVVTVRSLAVEPLVLLKGLALGIGATMLAALVPALEATLTPPRTVLRRSSVEERMRRALPPAALAGVALIAIGGLLLWNVAGAPTPGSAAGASDILALVVAFGGLFAVVLGCALLTPAVMVAISIALRRPAGRLFGLLGRMATRDLIAALSRTSVAVAALMVAISVAIGVGIMVGSFRQTVVTWLDHTIIADIYVSPPSNTATRVDTALDPALADELATLPGVAARTFLREVQVETMIGPVTMVALDTNSPRARSVLRFKSGGGDEGWDAFEQGALFISEPLAYRTGLGVGDNLRLPTDRGERELPIAGIYYDYTSDRGVIRISNATYRALWDDEAVSSLSLYVEPGRDVEEVAEQLRTLAAAREATLVIGSNRALREGTLAIFDRTFAITAVLQLLATVVAFIGILSALMALQLERARELAMLRASGLTPRQLWGLVLGQTGLMGLIAGLLAIPVGIIMALVLVYVINRRSFGWTLDLLLDPALLLQALLVALAAALLAGIYPALKMARTSPALALREE